MSNNEKNQPYYQYYIKNDGIGHVRYKYADENKKESIRGLSSDIFKAGETIYEKGEFDSHGKSINNPKEYTPGKKIYLDDKQAKMVEEKIKSQDKRVEVDKTLKYNAINNNCADFNQEILSTIDKNKTINEKGTPTKLSSAYSYAKYETPNNYNTAKDIVETAKIVKEAVEKAIVTNEKRDNLNQANRNVDLSEKYLGKESQMTKIPKDDKNSFKQTPTPMSEDEIRDLMKSDAYNNKYNPDYEKTQRKVRKAYEELYPDENKAENDFEDMKKNPENYYIWRAVGDSKTRSSHAMRDGEVFCWDNPPEGGHPGEDYNCRCEAEEYIPSR